jgi:hypothetical protein
LNGLAAKWAAQNSHLLPVDPQPVAPPLEQPAHAVAANGTESVAGTVSTSLTPSELHAESSQANSDPWEGKIVIS